MSLGLLLLLFISFGVIEPSNIILIGALFLVFEDFLLSVSLNLGIIRILLCSIPTHSLGIALVQGTFLAFFSINILPGCFLQITPHPCPPLCAPVTLALSLLARTMDA